MSKLETKAQTPALRSRPGKNHSTLVETLPSHLASRRWFQAVLSARTCYSAEIATYPSYALVKERLPDFGKTCGADRNRTDDIQLAKLALSQLSYSPVCPGQFSWVRHHCPGLKPAETVGLGGLEPPTSRLSGARSSQLSYRPRSYRVDSTASFILKELVPRLLAHSVLQNQTASPEKY